MIRIAAVGDLHFGADSAGTLRPHLKRLPEDADLFLLAGDLTRTGEPDEAAVLAEELDGIGVPVLAVLGNHDYHAGREDLVVKLLAESGVRVLEGDGVEIAVGETRVGIAGSKGFGGGFAGACGTEFGEPEMKAFMAHTRHVSERLEAALSALDSDVRIVLLHYAPIEGTLQGERLEIFPFLGSYLLAEAADRVGADLILHGHAHSGAEKGLTPGGIHVRNVSQPVIKRAYSLYCFSGGEEVGCGPSDGDGRARAHSMARG